MKKNLKSGKSLKNKNRSRKSTKPNARPSSLVSNHPTQTSYPSQSQTQDLNKIVQSIQTANSANDHARCKQHILDYIDHYGEGSDILHFLGVVYHRQKDNEKAAQCLEKSLSMKSDDDVRVNFAVMLREIGQYQKAYQQWEIIQKNNPDEPRCFLGFSEILAALGEYEKAFEPLEQMLGKYPDHIQCLNQMGVLLVKMNKRNEAAECYQKVLKLDPKDVAAHGNLALLHHDVGRIEQATYHYEKAIEFGPDMPEAPNNIATMWLESGDFERARDAWYAMGKKWPDFVDAHCNLALSWVRLRQPEKAIEIYKWVEEKFPKHTQHRSNYAKALLVSGQFEQGWQANEARWNSRTMVIAQRHFSRPQWEGEPLDGQIILIHCEQGYGDSLQFARYLPLLMQLPYGKPSCIIFEVQEPLVELMQKSLQDYGVEVVSRIESFPAISEDVVFDVHCPIMSLPKIFRSKLETTPSFTTYLSVPKNKKNLFNVLPSELKAKYYIGLVWAGAARKFDPKCFLLDQRRSIKLKQLEPLLSLQKQYDVRFISLQMDEPALQIKDLSEDIRPFDVMAHVRDFGDTAGLLEHLDLVVSVDTAVAHLAAALGRPVWMLNRFDQCWRWMIEGYDTVWYYNMRLYRQHKNNDWATLIREVTNDVDHMFTQLQVLQPHTMN
ncbi:MAG: tetratricopeptide repeat protein [Pseudomonadota bacterium]